MITAVGWVFGFVLLGKLAFKSLSITMGDFFTAGDVMLFNLTIVSANNP